MSQTRSDFDSLAPQVPFTRRGFVASMLASGFAAAVQPVMAQQVITTDTQGLSVGEIVVASNGTKLPAYQARPATGSKFPVVLVVQEIFGVHEHIKDVCRRLAKLGYLAVAPELYYRQGSVADMTNIQEILDKVVSKVPDDQVMVDLDNCVAWARANGGDVSRLAITGFCWGGRIVWLYAAHNPQLKAGVAWYGRLVGAASAQTPKQPTDLAKDLKAPVLGLYGGQDQGIPLDTVDKMREAIKAAGGKSEIHVYPDAPHAFHADYRPSYRKDAAEDGWKRLQAWLKQNGV
ncbi:MAG: twin-arginine translocation pathway signal [Proteobacteria bacterium]|nr:twin-arginine translocation pathway signal [Pseudomonadota bacterium]